MGFVFEGFQGLQIYYKEHKVLIFNSLSVLQIYYKSENLYQFVISFSLCNKNVICCKVL